MTGARPYNVFCWKPLATILAAFLAFQAAAQNTAELLAEPDAHKRAETVLTLIKKSDQSLIRPLLQVGDAPGVFTRTAARV